MKLKTLIALILFSIPIFAQNGEKILGTWIKTKVEAFNNNPTKLIKARDKKFIKYTFEKAGRMFMSSEYNKKGNEIKYVVYGDIVDLRYNKLKIEKLDNDELILVELQNNRISPNSARLYFTKEQVFLNKLPINESDIFVKDQDTTYFETQKVYPKFQNDTRADIEDFIQPYVEGLSNRKEAFSYASFIVNTNGKVSDIKIHHHINKKYDEGLKKAIMKSSGMWISPRVNGKKVKVLKEVTFHYIVFPDMGSSGNGLIIKEKSRAISDSYISEFKSANKELYRGNYENALKGFSKCIDMTPNNSNAIYQKALICKIMGDTSNYEKTVRGLSPEFSYLIKLKE